MIVTFLAGDNPRGRSSTLAAMGALLPIATMAGQCVAETGNAWQASRAQRLPFLFYQKSLKMFAFDFGYSDAGRDIGYDVSQRMWPSLAIAIPSLFLGLAINISFALLIVFFRMLE